MKIADIVVSLLVGATLSLPALQFAMVAAA